MGSLEHIAYVVLTWELGAAPSALEHYRGLNLKQIQHDTLSHLILSRASTFSLIATGDLTYSTECSDSSQIYVANSSEVCISALIFKKRYTYSPVDR